MAQRPKKFQGGEPIDRAFLNAVIDAIVQRLTINVGRIQRVGSSIAIQIDRNAFGGGSSSNKFGQVIACNQTTGQVSVQVATGGDIGSLTLGGDIVTAWAGIESWPRIGDDCVLIDNGSNVIPKYTCYVPIKGICWQEPEEAELAGWQDNPSLDTTSCDDTIS
jgi:hypothetical protein